jgi:hypothetical protein
MEMINVTSSNIASIGYDPETSILRVKFLKGSEYEYLGITPENHKGLMASETKGSYLARFIVGKYEHRKV